MDLAELLKIASKLRSYRKASVVSTFTSPSTSLDLLNMQQQENSPNQATDLPTHTASKTVS